MGKCAGDAEVGGHKLAMLESQAARLAFSVLDRMESTFVHLFGSMTKFMSKERSSSTELFQLCSGRTLEFCG